MKFFILIIFLLYSINFSLFPTDVPEEIDSTKNMQIKELIKKKEFTKAEEVITNLLNQSPGDPSLLLYRTQIWIEKADELYNTKKKKSAFAFYEKAYENWPSNPHVKERYNELKGKKLRDETYSFNQITKVVENEIQNSRKLNNLEEKHNSANLVLFSNDLNNEINTLTENLKQSNETLKSLNSEKRDKLEYLLYGNIFLSILSIILTLRRNK